MLCANLADPAPAGVAHSRDAALGATPGLSARHGPPPTVRSCGTAPVATPSPLVEHGPPPAARNCGAALGLSIGHEPLRAACMSRFCCYCQVAVDMRSR